MARILSFILLLAFFGSVAQAQSLKDISFGSESTLDIVTWNIEWFPKNGQKTADSVTRVIAAMQADVIALQEISDTALFKKTVQKVPGYKVRFAGSGSRGLAYVYNAETVTEVSFKTIYADERSAFPRTPYVMDMTFAGEHYVFINNHLKCCGDGKLDKEKSNDEETRRLRASELMQECIESKYATDRVIVLGDLNDLISDNKANNVFQNFIDDASNYRFADMEIANGPKANWSYPGWPSHLDHLLITNEIFNDLDREGSKVVTIKIEDHLKGGFSTYDQYISDHRPIGMALAVKGIGTSLGNTKTGDRTLRLHYVGELLNVQHAALSEKATVEICGMDGKVYDTQVLQAGRNRISIITSQLATGTYVVRLSTKSTIIATEKWILSR